MEWAKWSRGEKSLMIELYNKGMTLRAISERLGRPYPSTRKMRAKLGLPIRSNTGSASLVGGLQNLNFQVTNRLFRDMKTTAKEMGLTQASFIRQAIREKVNRCSLPG